jgi:hypothetical protein
VGLWSFSLTNYHFRLKNSSDSTLQKALKDSLQDNLHIVTARMDPLFDEFLLQARDGKNSFLHYASIRNPPIETD